MAKDLLTFSIFELIHEEAHPSIAKLLEIFGNEFVYEIDDNYIYSVKAEEVGEYYWMYIEYGAAHPRPSHLIDRSKSNALVENKRTESQVEPSRQLFCIYNPLNGTLYLSDSRKNRFLEDMLNHYGDRIFYIKRVIVDPEEFLRTLKTVNQMAIAAKTDLISYSGDLLKPIEDIFGYNAPDRFYISADYGVSITDKLKERFRFLNKECKEGKIKRFICVGKNDHGLETVFNTDNFTQKIIVSIDKQDNGLYSAEDVRAGILKQLDKIEEHKIV